MIKRIPTDVIFDLKELFDSMSVNQIVHFIMSLVQIGDRFTYLSSETMTKLVLELLDLKEEDIVFDLGSGNGGFLGKTLCYAKENHIKLDRVFGVDIDNNHVSTSNMALEILTSETKGNFDVKYSNILTDDVSFKYTKGYVFPPFNIKIFGMDSKFDTIFDNIKLTPRNNSELVFIDRLLNNINGKNPRAVALVSGRMLFNNADKEYREALINEGLLEGIIELPNNILEKHSN